MPTVVYQVSPFLNTDREREGVKWMFFSIYPDPSWASINHGVLVCDECCSVHRSLGRHISFVRSLHSTSWPPALREVRNLIFKIINNVSISSPSLFLCRFLSLPLSLSLFVVYSYWSDGEYVSA